MLTLFVCGFLIFGCIGGEQKPSTSSGAGSSDGSSGTKDSNILDDLKGKTYGQLVALGVPIECDITTTYSGQSTKYKIYMKAKEYRMEMDMQSQYQEIYGCKSKIALIVKGKDLYMGCDSGKIMPTYNCDLFKITSNESDTGTTTDYLDETELEKLPSTSFDCKTWSFDSTKFSASGKVCTWDDLISSYGYNYYNYSYD